MTTTIQIKSVSGELLFECEKEDNTLLKTLYEALKHSVDLSYADLRDADLRYAKLSCADLHGADLHDADLRDADLCGADLDFSCLQFSCKSLKAKTDERLRVQLCYHFLSWIKHADNATEQEKEIFEFCKEYANKFHRTDVEKF